MLLQVLQSIPLMVTTKHTPLSLPNPSKKHDLVRLLPTTESATPYHTTHGFPIFSITLSFLPEHNVQCLLAFFAGG